ncbi:AbrB family transcriptional regulator [Mangrovicoccus sp. HB161399]|uniref:AbrB family transcriptional regulator n=1 Tax=Mangrovicoccus sp. HB161399 TaxID=2720392 RepID=UPI0015550B69|nr:AbrB family transcriptional regulator [Mangrovicoccus sp. HB161399]
MKLQVLFQTLAVGALGAGLASLAGIPAPFLLGPAASVTVAALSGLSVAIPPPLRTAGFVLIGMGMGSGVTPEVVQAAARWPLSLVCLVLAVAAILWGGAWMMRQLLGLDRPTSILAAAPGHLSYVLSLGLDTKADLPQVTLIQSLRVLALTILTPPLVLLLEGEALVPAARMAPTGLPALCAMGAAALCIGIAFERLRIPAGMLMGAMVASSVGHGAGWVAGSVPQWLSVPGFVLMGCTIGTRFSGIDARMVLRALGGASMLTGLAVAVSSAAAFAASLAFGFPLSAALIAFAPGGVETMAAMALLLHVDPAYVALHHVVRIFALTFLIPLALGRRR